MCDNLQNDQKSHHNRSNTDQRVLKLPESQLPIPFWGLRLAMHIHAFIPSR